MVRITDESPNRGLVNKSFRNERGAIDLASIMTGIIVIGMIGGVIAATVFAVIPWTQDKAAKQQLDSVSMAQAAYKARSSAVDAESAGYTPPNSYGTSEQLNTASFLTMGDNYCTAPRGDGYVAFSRSSSGKNFTITDKNTSPASYDVVKAEDAALPGCGFLKDSLPAAPAPTPTPTPTQKPTAAPTQTPTPTTTVPSVAKTILTYKCDTTSTDSLPFKTAINGRLIAEGSDGAIIEKTYTNASVTDALTFAAGITYKVTLDGTYSSFSQSSGDKLAPCLRSMDQWDEKTGVTSAANAFYSSINLTSVPKSIPSTITNMNSMFYEASAFNQDISSWDTSNVTSMSDMFYEAIAFNQPLNTWNTSKVTSMKSLFARAESFNQPLDKWDTSRVTNMNNMFYDAKVFNQPLNTWNTSKVTNMNGMFHFASAFNKDISMWKFNVIPSHTDFNTSSALNASYLPKW